MTEPQETENHHLDQGLPLEWHAMEHDGVTYIVRDVPEGTAQLYAVSASSRNVRTFAKADAALYEGNVVRTYYDDELRSVEFIHDYAGTMGCHHVADWLEEAAIRLKKIVSGSGDLTEVVS